MDYHDLISQLEKTGDLSDDGLLSLILCEEPEIQKHLAERSVNVREKYYGKDVFLRGLIEFTNYCRNDCYYCGIRRSNRSAERYRLSEDDILSCCDRGYDLGFRTFVLQGGEDPYYTDDMIVSIVSGIKKRHPDCAVTLSIGEREKESYRRFREAGADRYLLRHETADREHYKSLHPEEMSFDHRMQCLKDLRETGFQVGCGMMIGSPGQEAGHILKDIRFIQEFRPEMVGMGPFIPHNETRYAGHKAGTADMTLRLLSIVRLILPGVLLPATTALGTIDPMGREKGIMAGANVLMPNLSPVDVRKKYLLYDNKICTGEEAAECIKCLKQRVESTGYKIIVSRGDPVDHCYPERQLSS